MQFVHQPAPSNRLGDYLKHNLRGDWTQFRAAVAFVKRSGTRHVAPALAAFARTRSVEVIAGVDHGGTSAEGLQDLLDAVSPTGRVVVFHNRLPFTFHPKIYLFKSSVAAELAVGSGNLTEGGLFTNYEALLRVSLNLTDPEQAAVLQSVEKALDAWADPSTGTARVLDSALLDRLITLGLAPSEAAIVPKTEGGVGGRREPNRRHQQSVRGAGRTPGTAYPGSRRLPGGPSGGHKPNDGNGIRDHPAADGRRRRSDDGRHVKTFPEIFIPLAARDANPGFWEWPDAFVEDPRKPGKHDRKDVRMRLAGTVVVVNMMTWPDKSDFRLRSEALRSAGDAGDVLRMERVGPGAGYAYYVEVIPRGTTEYARYLALCRQPVRNSDKKYGTTEVCRAG